jgi:hypothetical protein
MTVKIPDHAIGKNDLLGPLKEILNGVSLLGDAKDGGSAFAGPSQGVAILEANATALTKWWSVAVGALGGTTAIATAVSGFWDGETGGVRIALVAATGAILAAATIALAIIVSADVRGRAAGAQAIYSARAAIAAEFLHAASEASARPAAADAAPAPSNGATAASATKDAVTV